MFFEDPEEAIRAAFSADDTDAALAMLDTCRSRLTGREEEICERIASTLQWSFDEFSLSREEIQWFASLKIQFAREIAAWKDGVAV